MTKLLARRAIGVAKHFQPAEIVNSDKMQVYKGLDITTNKVTEEECGGVPNHLLGTIDPNINFTSSNFCRHPLSQLIPLWKGMAYPSLLQRKPDQNQAPSRRIVVPDANRK